MDGMDRQVVEAVAAVFASWGIDASVVDEGLLVGPEGVRALVGFLRAELERRHEMMSSPNASGRCSSTLWRAS